jgi:hypothetical protein
MNAFGKVSRGIAGMMVVIGSALAAVALSAAPAMASPSGYGCSGGLFCGWDRTGGEGAPLVTATGDCTHYDIGNDGKGDRLESYWNRTGKTVGVYDWSVRPGSPPHHR